MSERERITLSLPGEAVRIIEANSTPRTKADFVARCVLAYADAQELAASGILERIERKLDRLIRQTAVDA